MKLATKIGWYFFGETVSKINPFLLLPFFAQLFSPEEFSRYMFLASMHIIATYIILAYQDGSIARYFFRYGHRLLTTLILTGISISIFLTIVTVFILGAIINDYHAALIVTLSSFSVALYSTQIRLIQCEEKVIKYVSLQSISSVCILALTIWYNLIFDKNLLVFFVFNAFVNFILALYCLKEHLIERINLKINSLKRSIAYLTIIGVPGFFHQLTIFARGHTDRLILYDKFEDIELSNYYAAMQLASIIPIFIMAVNKGMQPWLWRSMKKGIITKRSFLLLLFVSLIITPIPMVFVLSVPENYFIILLGENFIKVKEYLVIFIFSFSLNLPYVLLISVLFYNGRHKIVTIITVATTAIYIILISYISGLSDLSIIPYCNLLLSIITPAVLFMYLLINIDDNFRLKNEA